MRELVRMVAGPHLYGTATRDVDRDLKSVILPAARDILLGNAKPGFGGTTPGGAGVETHSLQHFLQMLAEYQPLAVEMLFTPDTMLLGKPDPLWREVQAIGPSLLCRQTGVFVRYCRQQAEACSAKGLQLAAACKALAWFDAAALGHGADTRLEEHAAAIEQLAAATPHLAITDVEVQPGQTVRYLVVCGRPLPFTESLAIGRDLTCRMVTGGDYHNREAAQQDGVDWSALSHAVRIGREAVELLQTGRLAFPLHDAGRLLAIQRGQVPYASVVDEIDQVLAQVEDAKHASPLPGRPDPAAADALILRVYRDQVLWSA